MNPHALTSIALLAAAIVLFKLSTLQWRWPVRLAAWLLGAAALVGAGYVSIADQANFGVWRALADLVAQGNESLVWSAVSQNLGTLPDYLGPLIDFSIFVAGLIGLFCLVAFTPGEKLERTARTLFVGVIGMVIGAVLTVGVVALGFGGEAHRAVIVGTVEADQVLDGDTIMIGATSIRLHGLDAPELRQTCGEDRAACGTAARNELARLIGDRLVRCDAEETSTGRREESFGRPIMRCAITGESGAPTDLTSTMIASGHAVNYRDRNNEIPDSKHMTPPDAFALGCTLHPGVWRRNDAARRAWETDRGLSGGALTIGACRTQPGS